MPHLPQYLIPCTVRRAPTSDMKQRAPKGNTVLFDQCDGRYSEPGHADEHLDAICGESRADGVTAAEVTRHHRAPFSLLSCHKNTTTYTLCSSPAPSGGPRPQPHYVVFFKIVFTAVEILSVVVTSSITGTLKNSVSEGGGRRRKEEEEETQSRTSPPSCCSSPCLPAVSCGRRLTRRMALRWRRANFTPSLLA